MPHSIEIVTHSWRYARALAWQLDSLASYWDHLRGSGQRQDLVWLSVCTSSYADEPEGDPQTHRLEPQR